jgi:hypothetical protein
MMVTQSLFYLMQCAQGVFKRARNAERHDDRERL